jgi:hypothetical protein
LLAIALQQWDMTKPPAFEISDEKELLLACLRAPSPADSDARIGELLRQAIDWGVVIEDAGNHAVTPIVYSRLAGFRDAIPAGPFEELAKAYRANSARNIFLAAELARILDGFAAAQIEAVPYKGPAIAVQAYRDLTLREFEDLDIVVAQGSIAAAHAAMRELGFTPRFPWLHETAASRSFVPGEYAYEDAACRVFVEIHTERTLRHFPFPPDLSEFFTRCVPVTVGGSELRTFAPEDQLIFLAVHGAKDFWERLVWIADIAALLRAVPDLDWHTAVYRAESAGVGRMLRVGLALAVSLLHAPLPPEILQSIRADYRAREIAEQLERRILAPALPALGAGARIRLRYRMVSGPASAARYALRLAFVRSEVDYDSARLPRALRVFGGVLRPFRAMRKYASDETPPPES